MKIARAETFVKDYRSLQPPIRKAADKQIVQLLIDHTHPSLHLEAIAGHKGLFSVRVNQRYRISLAFDQGGYIVLRRILDHDALYRTP